MQGRQNRNIGADHTVVSARDLPSLKLLSFGYGVADLDRESPQLDRPCLSVAVVIFEKRLFGRREAGPALRSCVD